MDVAVLAGLQFAVEARTGIAGKHGVPGVESLDREQWPARIARRSSSVPLGRAPGRLGWLLEGTGRLLLDAVPGRDEIPHFDERLLRSAGLLASVIRGVVGTRLSSRGAPGVQLLLRPGQKVLVGIQRAAQGGDQVGLHCRPIRQSGGR